LGRWPVMAEASKRKPGRPAGAQPSYQEPKRESKSRFSLPRLGGAEQLRELVDDYGGLAQVARDLRIGDDLLNRYLCGQLEVPYSLLVALWWQTSYGFRQGFSESSWTHNYNTFLKRQAEARAQQLEVVVQHAVQLLEHRADAQDLLRASHQLAIEGRVVA
jgi:hypothetical protein